MAFLLILAGGGWILMEHRSTATPTPTIEAVVQLPTATFTPTPIFTHTPTPTPTTRADSRPIGTEPGQRAPDFALNDLEGRTHSLTDYHGQALVLDFWATWCGHCRRQLPILQAVSDKYAGQDVIILALDQKESAAQVASYRDRNGFTLTMLLDTRGQVGNDYAVRGLPTLYFIGRDGVIHAKKPGFTEQSEVEAEIEALLAQPTSP